MKRLLNWLIDLLCRWRGDAAIAATVIECEECGDSFEFEGELSPAEIVDMYRAHVAVSHEQESEDGD